jgi:hypothetical protein
VGLTGLQSQLAALATWQPSVVISFAAQIQLCQDIIASLEAAIAAGVTPPTIAVQVNLMVAVVAALRGSIQLMLNFQTLLASGGVFAYAWDGPMPNLGAVITSEFSAGFRDGSGLSQGYALILGTSLSATWASMGGVFKLTP